MNFMISFPGQVCKPIQGAHRAYCVFSNWEPDGACIPSCGDQAKQIFKRIPSHINATHFCDIVGVPEKKQEKCSPMPGPCTCKFDAWRKVPWGKCTRLPGSKVATNKTDLGDGSSFTCFAGRELWVRNVVQPDEDTYHWRVEVPKKVKADGQMKDLLPMITGMGVVNTKDYVVSGIINVFVKCGKGTIRRGPSVCVWGRGGSL